MTHFLYDEGQVAFVFEVAEDGGEFTHVRVSVKGYIIAITSITRVVNVTDAGTKGEIEAEKQTPSKVAISSVCQIFNLSGVLLQSHHLPDEEVSDVQVSAEGDLIFLTLCPGVIRICRIEDFVTVQEYVSPSAGATISATCFGPKEAVILLASGHDDGTLSLQLLPDASGSVSFLANVRRLLGVSAKLKRVKGTVQHAQTLAMSTLDNAKAVTSTARDIAGEALEFCERLAYYGLSGSLPIFFHRNLGLSTVLATELNSTFTSLSYLTPLLGAYVADRYLGRFATIIGFCLLYIAGLALCVFASLPAVSSLPLFMLGLFGGVGFGAGGIKPNVVVLGADQFDVSIPAQQREKDSFFNWFYWAINIGATFSYGVLTNLAVNGLPPYISADYGFFASFAIPSGAFVLAVTVFYMGKGRYRRVPPKGSALSKFFAVLIEAGSRSRRGKLVLSGGLAFVPGIVLTTASYFIQDEFTHMVVALTGAGAVAYGTFVLVFSGAMTDWLKLATRTRGGSFSSQEVQDAMQVVRLAPYLGIIIIFWAAYGQMNSNFVVQGCQMDLRVKGNDGVLLSSAMLNVVDSGVILIFIPVFDRLLYPFLTKLGIYPTLLRKVGTGLVFSMLAMIAAGLTEQVRKSRPMIEGVSSNCSAVGESLPMSSLSVWWQTPQYVLVGVSEILTSISSYDLFYSEVPESMRSVCQALNLLTTTLGFIVAGALNSIFSFWITSNLNDGHLEYIYYMMALLVLVLLVAFVFVSQSFEYHVPPPGLDSVSGFSPALSRAARELRKKLQFQRNGSK
ncbi:hypothetical protein BBJ29_003287 [Phytophthora kernoviae]|uniref:Major facilitator superfamily (MFS) profile domain-containing protein n=1 Tax=Phytophthora kernoviae TaxID=325452 RepID=A0A3F2RVL2_9STRA|nr:hypothetical protein BBP00_00003387 [Phytophthora kernoviae]RLN68801.1 hypothetical protein BBJ29_003287 [Phytophthora kernoviae]